MAAVTPMSAAPIRVYPWFVRKNMPGLILLPKLSLSIISERYHDNPAECVWVHGVFIATLSLPFLASFIDPAVMYFPEI
jgi:hypothetical protein